MCLQPCARAGAGGAPGARHGRAVHLVARAISHWDQPDPVTPCARPCGCREAREQTVVCVHVFFVRVNTPLLYPRPQLVLSALLKPGPRREGRREGDNPGVLLLGRKVVYKVSHICSRQNLQTAFRTLSRAAPRKRTPETVSPGPSRAGGGAGSRMGGEAAGRLPGPRRGSPARDARCTR